MWMNMEDHSFQEGRGIVTIKPAEKNMSEQKPVVDIVDGILTELFKDHGITFKNTDHISGTLDALSRYWRARPHLRLCQIVSNAWHTLPEYKRNPEPEINDIYYLPDNRFVEGLDNLQKQEDAQRARQEAPKDEVW